MGRIRIYPWKDPSQSAIALRDAFVALGQDALIIRRENSRYRPRENDFIINWGSSDRLPYETVNTAEAVALATNKLSTLQRLREQDVSCLNFETSVTTASGVLDGGTPLYARTRLSGSQGQGIVYIPTADGHTIPEARLYTHAEVGKEYRVHAMIDANGEGHMVRCQKRFKEVDDSKVRSHNNGYRFITGNFRRPHHIGTLAIDALKAVGLQFGSVDIINAVDREGNRTLKVLEINTASGLEGSSPTELAQAFLDHLAPVIPELPTPEPYTFDPDTEVKMVRADAA